MIDLQPESIDKKVSIFDAKPMLKKTSDELEFIEMEVCKPVVNKKYQPLDNFMQVFCLTIFSLWFLDLPCGGPIN